MTSATHSRLFGSQPAQLCFQETVRLARSHLSVSTMNAAAMFA